VTGDNHGDVESLRRVLDDVEEDPFDYAVHVGDFTKAWETSETDVSSVTRVDRYR
jgi:predicted phosphodiesterase